MEIIYEELANTETCYRKKMR